MGTLTKMAIEIGIKEHLRILTEEKVPKLTASLWIAGYGKTFKLHATRVYDNGPHPDIKLYNLFLEYSQAEEEFAGTRHVYLYSYYCPCYNCKVKWKDIPQQFTSIDFKWAFCKWYIPPPNTYGRYNSLENAKHHMQDMIGLGWKMRRYSTTITDNTLEALTLEERIEPKKD